MVEEREKTNQPVGIDLMTGEPLLPGDQGGAHSYLCSVEYHSFLNIWETYTMLVILRIIPFRYLG